MSYDYIRHHYGIDVEVNSEVQHDVTGRFGLVRPEGDSGQHYVLVQFAGDRHAVPCHPEELVFIGRAAA